MPKRTHKTHAAVGEHNINDPTESSEIKANSPLPYEGYEYHRDERLKAKKKKKFSDKHEEHPSGESVHPQTNNQLRGNYFKSEECVVPVSPGGDATRGTQTLTGTVVKTTVKGMDDNHFHRQRSGRDISGESISYFVLEEGGWGWAVCFASFCANFVIFGLMASFSELEPYINEAYIGGSEFTKWMGLVQCAVMMAFAPAAVVAEETVGLQASTFLGALAGSTALLASSFVPSVNFLFVTYSFVTGVAYAFMYVPSLVILGHYFDGMLGLVAGFVQVGTAMGAVCVPLFVQTLVQQLGLKSAIRIACVAVGSLVLCGLVWKPTYLRDVSVMPHGVGCRRCLRHLGRFFNYSVWTNADYALWTIAMVLSASGRLVPAMFLPLFAEQQGQGTQADKLMLSFWVASGLGGFVVGAIGDLSSVSRVTIQQIGFVTFGICLGMITFVRDFLSLMCAVVLLGLGNGATMSVVVPMLFDLLGPAGASAGLGSMLFLMAPLIVVGPIITVALLAEYFTFSLPFFASAAPSIVSAAVLTSISDERTYARALTTASKKESGIIAVDRPADKAEWGRRTPRENSPENAGRALHSAHTQMPSMEPL